MSKSALKLNAIKLRRDGQSVIEIAKTLKVAKSTASLWTRDIILTQDQTKILKQNSILGAEKGRIKGSLSQKLARLKRIEDSNKQGQIEINQLTNRELDIAGLCLYWSEGSKRNRRIELCNSDPAVILMYIKWLERVYKIPRSELHCYVGINEAHKHRENEVKKHWSLLTQVPLSSFTKTSFKKYPLKKVFENFNEHYGTLAVRVTRPARIFYRILGKIHAISLLAM